MYNLTALQQSLVCYYYNDMTIATTNYSTTKILLYIHIVVCSALTTLLLRCC